MIYHVFYTREIDFMKHMDCQQRKIQDKLIYFYSSLSRRKKKTGFRTRSFLLHELSFGRILHSRDNLDEDCRGNIPEDAE